MSSLNPEEFFSLYAMWGVDGISHLSMINGYAELLLKDKAENLTEEQKHYLEIIIKRSLRAQADWHHTHNYLRFRTISTMPFRKIDVHQAVQSAIEYVRRYAQIEDVKVKLPDNIPPVKGNDWLEGAIGYILDPQPPGGGFIGYVEDYTPTIEVLLMDDKYINFRSTSGLRVNPSRIQQPSDLLYPGTRLSAAKLIIQYYGGDVEIARLEPELEIRFSLPVWVESDP